MNVVFRVFPQGDVIALLCGTATDCNPGNVMSYMHIGQHGEASTRLARTMRTAKPEHYGPLLRELRSIYHPEPINPVSRLKA